MSWFSCDVGPKLSRAAAFQASLHADLRFFTSSSSRFSPFIIQTFPQFTRSTSSHLSSRCKTSILATFLRKNAFATHKNIQETGKHTKASTQNDTQKNVKTLSASSEDEWMTKLRKKQEEGRFQSNPWFSTPSAAWESNSRVDEGSVKSYFHQIFKKNLLFLNKSQKSWSVEGKKRKKEGGESSDADADFSNQKMTAEAIKQAELKKFFYYPASRSWPYLTISLILGTLGIHGFLCFSVYQLQQIRSTVELKEQISEISRFLDFSTLYTDEASLKNPLDYAKILIISLLLLPLDDSSSSWIAYATKLSLFFFSGAFLERLWGKIYFFFFYLASSIISNVSVFSLLKRSAKEEVLVEGGGFDGLRGDVDMQGVVDGVIGRGFPFSGTTGGLVACAAMCAFFYTNCAIWRDIPIGCRFLISPVLVFMGMGAMDWLRFCWEKGEESLGRKRESFKKREIGDEDVFNMKMKEEKMKAERSSTEEGAYPSNTDDATVNSDRKRIIMSFEGRHSSAARDEEDKLQTLRRGGSLKDEEVEDSASSSTLEKRRNAQKSAFLLESVALEEEGLYKKLLKARLLSIGLQIAIEDAKKRDFFEPRELIKEKIANEKALEVYQRSWDSIAPHDLQFCGDVCAFLTLLLAKLLLKK